MRSAVLTLCVALLAALAMACASDDAPTPEKGSPRDAGREKSAQTDGPRADGPRADGPRADGPRADGPRADAPGDAPMGFDLAPDGPTCKGAGEQCDSQEECCSMNCDGICYGS